MQIVKYIRRPNWILEDIRDPLGPLSSTTAAAYASRGFVLATFLAVYVIFEWISFIHEHNGVPITPWNPGLGVVFALMIFGGARYGGVLFAGIIVAEIAVLNSSLGWPIILGISAIIALGYGTVAAVARKYLRLDVGLNHLRDVFVLLTAGISGAALVALLLSLLLLTTAQFDLANILVASSLLFVGDAIGIAVMTPLALRLILRPHAWPIHSLRALLPEITIYVFVITISLWVIIGFESVDRFKYFYVLFLPVVVAAIRHGLDGACVGLALTQLALVGLLHRYGYDARAFAEFQILMLVLTATGLTVGIVVSERRMAGRASREFERRLKEKEAEVAQAARFSLVSGMATALAHEINQPMAAARALARSAQELLRLPQTDLSRADKNLTTLIAEIDLASGIVRRMRDFLRRGKPHVSTINVQAMIDEILTLVRPAGISSKIMLETDIANNLPPVYGDRVQLQQVILNLIRNAIDSIVESGRADGRIRIAAQRSDESKNIEISVLDNGPGIPTDLADRLFQPLTTSKSEGLGLGLSISLAIVEAHQGRLWLHSNLPGATEFRFSLPLEPPKQM